jgi:hypothetical protein
MGEAQGKKIASEPLRGEAGERSDRIVAPDSPVKRPVWTSEPVLSLADCRWPASHRLQDRRHHRHEARRRGNRHGAGSRRHFLRAAPQSAPRAMVPVNSDFPQPSDRAAPRGFYPAIRRSVNLCRHVASPHARDQSPFRDDRSPPSSRPPRGQTADDQTVGLQCCGWRTCAVGLVHIGSTLACRQTVGRWSVDRRDLARNEDARSAALAIT